MQNMLSQQFAQHPDFVFSFKMLRSQISSRSGSTARRLELELMHLGKARLHYCPCLCYCTDSPGQMKLPADTFFDTYIASIRKQTDALYTLVPTHHSSRFHYHTLGIQLASSIITAPPGIGAVANYHASLPAMDTSYEMFLSTSPALNDFDFDPMSMLDCTVYDGCASTLPDPSTNSSFPVSPVTPDSGQGPSTAMTSPNSTEPTEAQQANAKAESNSCCEICGYRPEGDPRWFPGSMAKHKKLQHASSPPKIYQCPYPGCSSKYTNRPDNLRQHQLRKGHFVDGESSEKPRVKRKKMN